MDARRQHYLKQMGITCWVRRAQAPALSQEVDSVPSQAHSAQTAVEAPVAGDWSALEHAVADCTACALHAHRARTVFATGARESAWMVIGAAPTAQEEDAGEPFVGAEGRLLTAMLKALGLAREAVFVTNALKCRPPQDRSAAPEEAAACATHLRAQIALVRPRLLLVMGSAAAHYLLDTDAPLARLRGRTHRYGGDTPLVVTHHPAALLRAPQHKAQAWQDLLYARQVAAGPA